jgi:hypothetical protein
MYYVSEMSTCVRIDETVPFVMYFIDKVKSTEKYGIYEDYRVTRCDTV